MSDLIYSPQGAYAFFRRADATRPVHAAAVNFADAGHVEHFLTGLCATPASRAALQINYCRLVHTGSTVASKEEMIRDLAPRIENGEIIVNDMARACGRPPGKDAIERPPAPSPPGPAVLQPPPVARASDILKKNPGKITEHKITVEVAGKDLSGSMGDFIATAPVKQPGGEIADHRKSKPVVTARQDDHRHEVELLGLTDDERLVSITIGCNEASDACCMIPLQTDARPVDASTEEDQWPTVLIPMVPLAYTDEAGTREKAERLRNGWLYIYRNHHLWREIYVSDDGVFRDVNLGLPDQAGFDVREPSGHASNTILVPYTIDGEVQTVTAAFAEVQWTWHTICTMGGPADDDPRFLPKVIAKARQVPVDVERRDRRFVKLDFSCYPGGFDSADQVVGHIADAPGLTNKDGDPFRHLRHKKIAAVYLHDPLMIARSKARDYQQAWRDMQACIQELATTPQTDLKERKYAPARWFDSAVLANRFFFGAFPDFASWEKVNSGAGKKQWQKAKEQREKWQARLDKDAIDEALGKKRRAELRPVIEKTKKELVDFLDRRAKDEQDLFVLMLDDYFTLPNCIGKEKTPGHNPCGYVDGWAVVEQLIARLGDHPYACDAELEAEPPDTARLAREDPGRIWLASLADPDKDHNLHPRLFAGAAGKAYTPDLTPTDVHAPGFTPQLFDRPDDPGCCPVADFATHFACIGDGAPAVRYSLLRLINAVFQWQLAGKQEEMAEIQKRMAGRQLTSRERMKSLAKAVKGQWDHDDVTDFLGGTMVFSKSIAEKAVKKSKEPLKRTEATADVYSVHEIDPQKLTIELDDKKLAKYDMELKVGRTVNYKGPLPDIDSGYVRFPNGLRTMLKVVDPNGKIIGGLDVDDMVQGDISLDKMVRKHNNTLWNKTRVNVILTERPDLLSHLGRQISRTKTLTRVIVPLVAMFETWNVSSAFTDMVTNTDENNKSRLINDFFGSVGDFAAFSAALSFDVIERVAGKSWLEIVEGGGPHASRIITVGFARAPLGIAAASRSALLSGREMMDNLRQNDDAAIAHGFMCTGLVLTLAYETGWAAFFIGAVSKTKILYSLGSTIISSPLLLMGLFVALVGAALLVFVFREDTPLEEWLANGPLSISGKDKHFIGEKSHPDKKFGDIGRPRDHIAPPAMYPLFGGHHPGDVDWGPPEGGEQVVTYYPATKIKMVRWTEPDGSFLWYTLDGSLEDYKVVPNSDGRLFEENNTLYLRTESDTVILGQRRRPIFNRDKLKVDRKDKGDKFRNWCEKPATAHLSLAAAIFSPSVALGFFRTSRPDIKYPGADPFKGYDHFARIHVGLPHFNDGQSRLHVQMWEQFDLRPELTYDHRIILSTDENGPLRRIELIWPLAPVRSRYSKISVKVRLDLYGDGRLWLPLADDGHKSTGSDWTIVEKLADRFLMPRNRKKT